MRHDFLISKFPDITCNYVVLWEYHFNELMISQYYLETGNLEMAKTHLENVLSVYSDVPNVNLSLCCYFLGVIHLKQGSIEEAIKVFNKGIATYDNLPFNVNSEADRQVNIKGLGMAYQMLDQYELSQELLDMVWSTDSATSEDAHTLSIAMSNWCELDQTEKGKTKLKELKEQLLTDHNFRASQYLSLAEAILFKYSSRMYDKGLAQQILRKLLDQPNLIEDIEIQARLQLLDLLITELDLMGDFSILEEIIHLLNDTEKFGEKLNSQSLLVHIKYLKSKIAIINCKYDEGIELLNKSYDLADTIGLDQLKNNISRYRSYLQTNINRWNRMVDNETGLKEHLARSQIVEYIKLVNKVLKPEGMDFTKLTKGQKQR